MDRRHYLNFGYEIGTTTQQGYTALASVPEKGVTLGWRSSSNKLFVFSTGNIGVGLV
jgi:hypothetical protein